MHLRLRRADHRCDAVIIGEDLCAFDGVSQLANVAWPVIEFQSMTRFVGDFPGGAEEMIDEQRHVASRFRVAAVPATSR